MRKFAIEVTPRPWIRSYAKPTLRKGISKSAVVSASGNITWNSHYNKDRTGDHTLKPATQDWFGYDGERLVDHHVRQEKGDQEEVAILANR